jgi:hypothetical protein
LELDRDKLNTWFHEKWDHGACAVCGTNLWTPLPRLGMVPNLNPTGPVSTNVVPMLLISCTSCGYTLHINALVAGILREADWAEELSKYSPAEAVEQPVEASG